MANETQITVVGNLTADPELRYTQAGLPVVNLTVASTPRTFDRASNEWKDGEALFLRASAWRQMAEHIASSLTKGMRVIAQGNLKQKSYQDKDGNNRTSIELEILDIGPSLQFATAQVTRAAQGGGQQAPRAPQVPQQGGQQYGPPQGTPQYGPPQGAPQQAPQAQAYPAPTQQAPQQAPAQPQQAPQQWSQPAGGFDQAPF